MEPYNLRARLKKLLQAVNLDDETKTFADGIDLVLTALSECTGVDFGKIFDK